MGATAAFENLTIKKIPQAVLTKCEWARDDYSLRVASLPLVDEVSTDLEPNAGGEPEETARTQEAGTVTEGNRGSRATVRRS